jgi:hypothetical protein
VRTRPATWPACSQAWAKGWPSGSHQPGQAELTLHPAYSGRVRDPVAMHAGPVPDLQDVADGTSEGQPPAATPNPPGNLAVDADILAPIRRDRA